MSHEGLSPPLPNTPVRPTMNILFRKAYIFPQFSDDLFNGHSSISNCSSLWVGPFTWTALRVALPLNLHIRPFSTKRCLMVYKCQHHHRAPLYLSSLCVPLSSVTTRRHMPAATQDDLNFPRARSVTNVIWFSCFCTVSGPAGTLYGQPRDHHPCNLNNSADN